MSAHQHGRDEQQTGVNFSSPLLKVIFNQRVAKYSCRTVSDILTFNSVCQDFQETIQGEPYHTFNLIFYSNVVTVNPNLSNPDWLLSIVSTVADMRSSSSSSSDWIIRELTIVNENPDQKHQRDILDSLFEYDLDIRSRSLLFGTDTKPHVSTFIFQHILDTCEKLGLTHRYVTAWHSESCILRAARSRIPLESLKMLVDKCVEGRLDVKALLESSDHSCWNFITVTMSYGRLPLDSLRFLIDLSVQYGVSVTDLLQSQDVDFANCLMNAFRRLASFDKLKFLIDVCEEHNADMNEMLAHTDAYGRNAACIAISAGLEVDSLKLVFDTYVKHGFDMKRLIEDPDDPHSNLLLVAACSFAISGESLEFLLESCAKFGVDVKTMLEQQETDGSTIPTMVLSNLWQAASISTVELKFRRLINCCVEHGVNTEKMMEQQNSDGITCLSIALGNRSKFGIEIVKLVISAFPSNQSFQRQKERFMDNISEYEAAVRELFENPECWELCRREVAIQNQK